MPDFDQIVRWTLWVSDDSWQKEILFRSSDAWAARARSHLYSKSSRYRLPR